MTVIWCGQEWRTKTIINPKTNNYGKEKDF